MTTSVLARSNHPARLAGVFASSILAFGIVAAAAAAILYIVESEGWFSSPPAAPTVNANVDLPPGLILIRRVEGPVVWASQVGFEPIAADVLPDGVDATPLYFLQQPDATGRRAGHLRYTAQGGPLVVLVEQQGTLDTEPEMQATETDAGRAYTQWVSCGNIVIQAQLYFSLDAAGSPLPASQTATIAERFVAALRDQCS